MTKNILITKAKEQAFALEKLLREAGYKPYLFPSITIEAIDNASLNKVLQQHYDGIIFTSVNAVNCSQHYWPNGFNEATCFAVGPSTAKALQKYNIDTIIPEYYSSEGLVALKSLHSIKDKSFLIICGEDPKPLLQNTLEQRGASVAKAICYRRSLPKLNQKITLAKLKNANWQFIISTSLNCLKNLYYLFNHKGQAWLNQQHFVVINKEMLDFLHKKGNTQPHLLAENATNLAIIKVLLDTK